MMKRVRHPDRLGLHLRVVLGGEVAMGPGKAELLDGIAETGSIAAAGRRMGMSYRRAWLLVEELNATFAGPLVDAAKGGAGGGGAVPDAGGAADSGGLSASGDGRRKSRRTGSGNAAAGFGAVNASGPRPG